MFKIVKKSKIDNYQSLVDTLQKRNEKLASDLAHERVIAEKEMHSSIERGKNLLSALAFVTSFFVACIIFILSYFC